MERLRSPLYAQIELTYACNLACNHCYNEPRFSNNQGIIRFNRVKRENVETDRFRDIAQELVRNDVFAVTLTGGEVFTARDRLYSTIDVLASSGLEVTLNSNLTLVNEDDIKRLRDSGVNGIMTSLLSYNPEVHDKIVNKEGSHKRTVEGTELMLRNGIYVSANMVVSKANKDDIYETGRFAGSLGIESFSAAQAIPSSSGGDLHLGHALSFDEVIQYLKDLDRVRQNTGMFVKLTNPLPYCSVWDSNPELRYLVETSSCTAGRTIIQINPKGEVMPCPMVSQSYGNILEEGLDVIWQRMSEWNEDKFVPESCEPCDLVDICRGACRAEAERTSGSLDAKSVYSVKPIKLDGKRVSNLPNSRLEVVSGLKARKERDGVYVLFAKDRFMVASETASRFISTISSRGGIDVNKLNGNNGALEVITEAYYTGILKKGE